MFQVVFIHARPEGLPFIAPRSSSGLRVSAIYVRREGQTEEASYDEVQKLIEERLFVAPQTVEARNLKEHLGELKVLYAEIPRTLNDLGGLFAPLLLSNTERLTRMLPGLAKSNPAFPEEDYQIFIRRLLDGKKTLIERLAGC